MTDKPIELSELLSEYKAGRVRHFRPYCARDNAWLLDIEVLTPDAEGDGESWRIQSVKKDGETLWLKSHDDVLETLSEVGLAEAYANRFEQRNGMTYSNW